jgi:muramoyltetrapeptide carboxypeptidase LdcA involved in peptidoglycan recycling
MEAFADPANKAVFTSIGGFDQIRLIKYLDPQVILPIGQPARISTAEKKIWLQH